MTILTAGLFLALSIGATNQPHYYAHDAVLDSQGVIAPWYGGQNGQFDLRVRIATETMKRYPWTMPPEAVTAVPAYMFNGVWSIDSAGTIATQPLRDWDNGDFGQRAAYVLRGLVDYYRYSGDPAAVAHIALMGDLLLDYCQTPPTHPWPSFLVSVPNKGKPYGACNPDGIIQLDIVGETGLALLYGYQMTGEARWLEACKHWADVLAEKRNRGPGMPPWDRYANPEVVQWSDQMTGGVVFLLCFFDELIRLGYTGANGNVVEARDAGRAYLRDVLLPRWHVDDTWGRNYWDWWDSVQAENVTEFTARYLMDHPDVFPHWRNDTRNIVSLFFNRTSVAPESRGDVYSGAWAFPESSGCCGRSLSYGPQEISTVLAEYGARADSPWATEVARRAQILATYDFHQTGVVEDNIDGQFVVAGSWFKIAHPMALKHALGTMAWLPEVEGANRENHLMRSGSVVKNIEYADGRIAYEVFDAPAPAVDVLRLAFRPATVQADGAPLVLLQSLDSNGYTIKDASGGDCIVSVRHDGLTHIGLSGDDPQEAAGVDQLQTAGTWSNVSTPRDNHAAHDTSTRDSRVTLRFTGNQVRLVGSTGPDGGLADVYLDGAKQLVPIDFWTPHPREHQTVYFTSGLTNGEHTFEAAARGAGNPVSKGARVVVETAYYSAATGNSGYGEGSGPATAQRMVFGRVERPDYVDSAGDAWVPATEWVTRMQSLADIVQRAYWTERRRLHIANTPDPELYRYGAHAPEFWANLTTAPGQYHVRLKFAETRDVEPKLRAVSVFVNGEPQIVNMDIAATAGGFNRAVDVVLNGVQPKNGVIEIRLKNEHGGEAILQALELAQGDGGAAATPVLLAAPDTAGK